MIRELEQDECSEGLCEGSGIVLQGEFDDIIEVPCICTIET